MKQQDSGGYVWNVTLCYMMIKWSQNYSICEQEKNQEMAALSLRRMPLDGGVAVF